MAVKIRLNKGPLQIEWELDSMSQANTQVFGKICDEMVRIHEFLQHLKWERQYKRKQRRYQRSYQHTQHYVQNRALKCLRYLFEVKP